MHISAASPFFWRHLTTAVRSGGKKVPIFYIMKFGGEKHESNLSFKERNGY